jgi:hypothetical protein
MIHDPAKIDEFLSKFEIELLKRYNHYVKMSERTVCKVKKRKQSLPDHETFNINYSVLKEAVGQIKMDIKILLMRRGNMISDMRMCEGKIAGVIAYRLAKAHIIHIDRKCNICIPKCFSRMNNTIAIRIGLDYINKKYTDLPTGIRNELVYTVKNRHVNQETLGLVFDTFLHYIP